MAQINWTAQALEDLADINTYHTNTSERYASFVIDTLLQGVEQLERFPMSGRMVVETNIPSMRELILLKYRVIYQIIGSTVHIVTVRYSNKPFSEY